MASHLSVHRTVPVTQAHASSSDTPTNQTATTTTEPTPVHSLATPSFTAESATDTTTTTASTATTPKSPTLATPTLRTSNPQYTVFISHAGEDKATIAIPLKGKLIAHGITAFVDDVDMPPGTEARAAMNNAMETTRVAVIVLSPEYVARKWPMRELMYFLRRREERGSDQDKSPIIIPFFYRLNVGELYNEPRLDRTDKDGRLLYRESRFRERQANGEPEANIESIKTALREVHGIMGVRNDVAASNDPAYVMSRRREVLLDELCETVRHAVPPWAVKKGTKRKAERTAEEFAHFDGSDASEPSADYDSKDEDGTASTQARRLLEQLLELWTDVIRAIAVRGIGRIGNTSLLRGISSLKEIKKRLPDGYTRRRVQFFSRPFFFFLFHDGEYVGHPPLKILNKVTCLFVCIYI